ncbi:MAG: AAA family ATPase [Elusimicrobia bacterium]|nr:AAA family ATPase [Elusimicrobiota bacterium]
MRIVKIQIDNILGLEHLDIAPGALTVVEGANGTGKTSVLEAIKAGLGGGRDATLLRKGAKEGQVVLVLDDGTEITKRVKADGAATATVKHPTFGAIAKPQSYLDKLADALSVNPIAFLAAPPTKRAAWLLEVLPSKVTDEDLAKAGVTALPPASVDGLQRIEAARKAAYDERTGVNRTSKEKRATIAQLEAALPPDSGADPRQETATADQDVSSLNRELATKLEKVRSDEAADTKAVNAETDAAIRKLEATRTQDLAAISAKSTSRREEAAAEIQPRIDEATARAAAARTRAERYAADQRSRTFIAEHREAVEALEENASRLTATLEKLDALKAAALANLPIKGVEVRDGEVYVDDIPFDRVNRARQIRVALNVARLRAGQLGLVCVDGLESLDADTFAQFEKAAEKSGLQFVVNRVTQGPLTVRAGGAAA